MKTTTIQGFENYSISENGEIINTKTNIVMRPYLAIRGYYIVGLTNSIKQHKRPIHRLLAIAFLPNPDNLPAVNHIDGNKLNNDLSNLEWCTHSENNKHAWSIGLQRNTEKMAAARSKSGLESRKWILNTETGIYYKGIYDAMESLPKKVTYKYLSNRLGGWTINNTALKYAVLIVGIIFSGCSKKIDWAKGCAERFPPTTKFIEGKTIIETDTIYEGNLIIQSDPILVPGKCPPNKTITITKRRIDTIETEGIGAKAKISLLERKNKESEELIHSYQKQTLEALKIVDEYKLERNKARTQRNIAIFGIGLLTLWSLRKILAKIISPFL